MVRGVDKGCRPLRCVIPAFAGMTALARRILLLPLAALLSACAAPDAAVAPDTAAVRAWLLPQQPILGGRLVAPASADPRSIDPTGMPRPGGAMPFRRFVFPAALAVREPDLYVADSGANTLWRFELGSQLMHAIGGVGPVLPTLRLAAAADHSLWVLNPGLARVQRFSRGGRPVAEFSDPDNLPQPTALAVDAVAGRVWVADATYQHVVGFHVGGGAPQVLAARGPSDARIEGVAAIAADRQGLYFADPACRCVSRLGPRGEPLGSFGAEALRQPHALVVDRWGRVWVADGFDQSLKLFVDGRLAASLAARDLGLRDLTALALDQGTLYIADGLGGRVGVYRLRAPEGTR